MSIKHPLIKPGKVTLRAYQEALIARSVEKNTLVVLPTGLGKTMVAVIIAVQRLSEHPGSKILFLAPTRPLVEQHKKTFDDLTNITDSVILTGLIPVKKRGEFWSENTLIFATPQTIENDLLRGLDLSDVSLVVFDEAHKAMGEYAYVYIAGKYAKASKHQLILGLTASPSAQKEKIDEIVKNLYVERIEAKTEQDGDVKPYVADVKVKWVQVELPQEFKKLKVKIEEILRDRVGKLKTFEYLKSADLRKVNKRTLLAIQSEIRKEITQGKDSFQPASLVAETIKVNHALELLETQGLSPLNEYFGGLSSQRSKAVKNLFADARMREVVKIVHDLVVLGVEHPKLDEVGRIVAEYKDRKVLIFSQYRDSVEKIIERLNEMDILAHEFIGQASRGAKSGMSQKKQVEVLDKFRKGDYTALVATSVAEEGLDIPAVDLVIFYEPIPSEIRSIQRRGRTGRGQSGEVVVLMAKGTRDEGYFWSSVHKERKMGKLVKSMRDEGFIETEKQVNVRKEDKIFPGQKSLLEYGVTFGGGLKIYIDGREKSRKIIEWLSSKATIEIRNLPVGDYLVSDRVAIERKTINDFLQSMIDKRLLSQMRELSRNFENVIMILEGTQNLYSQRNIHPNAIRGALASIMIDFKVPIISTEDEQDTAAIIYALAKREQEAEGRLVALRGERKPLTLFERQIFVVESLPNVSAVLARRLLTHFGSIENIVKAGEKELIKVEGIGGAKASEIRKVLKSRFQKKV